MPAVKISPLFQQINQWENFAAHSGPDAHNRVEWGSYLRTIYNDVVSPWILGRAIYPDIDDVGE